MSRDSLVRALWPGLMVPPYTMMEGRFTRAIAMTVPGMFLSQPGSEMLASYLQGKVHMSLVGALLERCCMGKCRLERGVDITLQAVEVTMPSHFRRFSQSEQRKVALHLLSGCCNGQIHKLAH